MHRLLSLAFLLLFGSVFYFVAARWFGNVNGIAQPIVVLR